MKKIVMLLLLLASSVVSGADDRTGPYLAVGGGYAVFYDDKRMGTEPVKDSYNINVIGGAFINKYLSVELGLDYFDTFRNEFDDVTDIYIIDATAKAHYPVWRDRIDLYAAFGAGSVNWKENVSGITHEDSSGVLKGDVGVGFRSWEWLTLNIGYRRYYFTLDQLDSGGLVAQQYNMELSSAYATIEVLF